MHTNLSRFQAFAIHLFISSAILGAFLSIVLFIWYPQPFFVVEGLVEIVWVLVGVDIVLGPTLTLIVFKAGKPSLKWDMSVIAGIQIIGFIYGAHTFFVERPAFAVMYDADYFEVIPSSGIEDARRIDPALDYSSIGGPLYVFVEAPTKIDDLKVILEDMKKGGPGIQYRQEFYKPLQGRFKEKFYLSWELDQLFTDGEDGSVIKKFKSKYGEQTKDFAYFPILGKVTTRLLVIDRDSEAVVDYIDIKPVRSN